MLCFGKLSEREPTIKYCLGGQVDVVQKFITIQNFGHNWWWANGIRVEYSPGFTTLQLCYKVHEYERRNHKILQDGLSKCRRSTTSHGDLEKISKNANQALNSFRFMQTRFSPGRWSFLGPGSEKKWYSTLASKHQGECHRVAELMMLQCGESRHPILRSTSPLSRGVLQSNGGGNLSIHFCADEGTIETVFRTIIHVNQLSIYGAVSDLCEECKSCHVRTGRPVLVGQSDPLFGPTSVMKTPTPLTDDPAQEDLLQKYHERVDKLSQQNCVTKFCTDAGCLTTVDVGQYFMTKDIEEFSQFTESVACREYTLPRDEKSSDPKGWIRGNTVNTTPQMTYFLGAKRVQNNYR